MSVKINYHIDVHNMSKIYICINNRKSEWEQNIRVGRANRTPSVTTPI